MRAVLLVVAFTLAGTALARDKTPAPVKPPAPAPRGIVTTTAAAGQRTDARLDGRLVTWAELRGAEGRHEIVVLLAEPPATLSGAPDTKAATGTTASTAGTRAPPAACTVAEPGDTAEKPGRLARLDLGSAGRIEVLRSDVPGDTTGMGAVDVDADGRDELVLFRPGRVELIARGDDGRFGGERVALVEDSDVGNGTPMKGLGLANEPEGVRLRLAVVGAVRTWVPDPSRTRWRTLSDAPTPFDAAPETDGLHLVGPRILPCGRDATGRVRFATEAEVVGRDRLRARLLDPEAAPEARSLTCWAKLPAPERVLEQTCLMLDGAPHLAVTTMSSEKMSFFGEKRLRLFPLAPDRSRTGVAPRFAVTSGLNLWQPTTPELTDVNRDGRSDLVLAYWKGLKDSIAVLEVYPARAGGGFESSARRTEIEVDDGEKNWIHWGDDVDGDGRADLLLFAGKKLLLLPGTDSSDARRLAASKPSASLPWPDDAPDIGWVWTGAGPEGASGGVVFGSLGVPTVSDFDGDGRVEVILAGNDDAGGRVIVFSFSAKR